MQCQQVAFRCLKSELKQRKDPKTKTYHCPSLSISKKSMGWREGYARIKGTEHEEIFNPLIKVFGKSKNCDLA